MQGGLVHRIKMASFRCHMNDALDQLRSYFYEQVLGDILIPQVILKKV